MSDPNSNSGARAQPKYGELAPEGWSWKPPDDVDRLDTARPPAEPPAAMPTPEPETIPGVEHQLTPLEQASGLRLVPAWNRPVTFLLLMVGLLGMLFSVATLAQLPVSMQIVYTNESLGTYRPAASVPSLLLAGQITQGVIWALGVVVSVILIARRRLSFYVPLVAGAVAAVMFIVFIMLVISTDPTLLNSYGKF